MSDAATAIVVGAGVFGASTAWRFQQRGWDVTLVEAVQPGHVRASSGGRSRLIRFAHGDDVWHTRSVIRAMDGWEELEAVTGEDLLVRCGVAWFAREDDGWEAAAAAVLEAEGVEAERMTGDEAQSLYPSLRTDDLAFVLYEPDAGVLRAARAVRALTSALRAAGGRVLAGQAQPHGTAVVVDEQRLTADAVVWACGPWLPRLFPEL
ncbi:MAG: FAD-dependent oxidoreductase, partial [Nitriliruptorales bacterium]|nr:FAD-dependent oxidoreductase [Nitriliruptorales bacterium]